MLEGGDRRPIVLLAAEFAAVWLRVIPDLVTTVVIGGGQSGLPGMPFPALALSSFPTTGPRAWRARPPGRRFKVEPS